MSKGRQVRRAATFLYVCLAARVLPGLTAVNGVVTDSTGAVVPGRGRDHNEQHDKINPNRHYE